MNPRHIPDEDLRARIEAEYREMPGLSLTAAQAARLWTLDSEHCARVLSELINTGFLRCGADGRYCRDTGSDTCHWRRRVEIVEEDHDARLRFEQGAKHHADTGQDMGDAGKAFAAILAAAVRADGSVLPCEIDRLKHALNFLPVFRGRSEDMLRVLIRRVVYRPSKDDTLGEAAAALPPDLRGTAFAAVIDVLLADGRLRASELQFVRQLRRLLHVRRSVARRMLGVLAIKNLVRIDAQLEI